jgi:hypothetical protein
VKFIQIGILAALVVVAGLLFMVWRGQHSQTALTSASVPEASPAVATTTDLNAVTPAPEAAPQPPAPVEQKPAPAVRSHKRSHPTVAQNKPPENMPAPSEAASPAPPPPQEQPVQAPPALPPSRRAVEEPIAAPPPPPPPPRTVTIPGGTILSVRLVESLSSDKNQAGDSFTATLDQPLVVDGFVIAERGARVEGRVTTATQAGRVKGVSDMALQLVRLNTSDGQTVPIQTAIFEKEGPTSKKEDAEKVGIGAAIGAAIGAIAGGGRGAAIGAGAGGAAGGGTVLATRGKAVVFPSETRLSFRLAAPVTLTEKRH